MQVQPGGASDGMPKRRVGVGALFFPVTWPGRFAFFSVIVFIVFPPAPQKLLMILFVLCALALAIASPNRPKHHGFWIAIKSVFWIAIKFLFWLSVLYWSTMAVYAIAGFLALLVSNGAPSARTSYGSYWNFVFAEFLIVTILWLLLGIPHRAYRFELGKGTQPNKPSTRSSVHPGHRADTPSEPTLCSETTPKDGAGDAQRLLVRLLATAAAMLSGIFLWLLHYTVVAGLTTGQLVAGIVFTIALMAPYYASLARACCQRGLFGVLSPKPLAKHWHQLVTEMQSARVSQASESLGWLDRTLQWLYTYQRHSAAP
jgi:hypothetical protein